MTYVPLWLSVTACCVLGWVCLTLKDNRYKVSSWLKGILVAAVIIAVFLFASFSEGLGGLSSLLIAGAMLKSLELKKQRDGWVLVLVACFIAAVGFLFNQSLLAAIYGAASLVTIVCALLMMHQADGDGWLFFPIRKSFMILFQSMPLMLILFLIFPRIGPLWNVQSHNSVAKTGLSDRMEPGNISRLTRSDSVAFRVSFADDKPPLPSQLYWRAMTYTDFDGQRWSISDVQNESAINNAQGNDLLEYQVIAEPSASSWLFALDYPFASRDSDVQRYSDGTFKAKTPVYERVSYSASSILGKHYDGQPLNNRSRYLSVPAVGNPQTREMVRQWQQKGLSSEEIITALFKSFNQNFIYTLSPQKLTNNRIDQFLFTTREGFCEHFANATAFVLRLAGIPTRVVGGYLGGEWNAYEKYMLIRQYEAHAWVEAWLDGKGWIRLDPTAAVAPERVVQAFDQLFSSSPEFMVDSPLAVFRLQQNMAWLKVLNLRYDAINYSWHRWVLGYHQEQNNLLQQWFGKINIIKMLLLLFIPVGCVFAFVVWWLLKVQPHRVDPMDKKIELISAQLGKISAKLQRSSGETVNMYSERLARALPDLQEDFKHWAALYHRLRYTPCSTSTEENLENYQYLSRLLLSRVKRLKRRNIVRKDVE